jgi:hypothetical protein
MCFESFRSIDRSNQIKSNQSVGNRVWGYESHPSSLIFVFFSSGLVTEIEKTKKKKKKKIKREIIEYGALNQCD